MDIVRFKGGLGNQMFQYALLKALNLQGRKVMTSLGYYIKYPETAPFILQDVFKKISLDIVDECIFHEIDKRWREIKQDKQRLKDFSADYAHRFFWVEEAGGTYNKHIFETCDCVFVGYWQTEKYFSQCRTELLSDFQFMQGEERLGRLKQKIVSRNNYVSVHIRRGDYLQHSERYGNICTEQYYDAAMAQITMYVSKPIFVFFSDDIQWVKEHYKVEEAIYIEAEMFEHYQAWYDMCLMSCCSYNIIANSSFSWWGAWLNQRPEKKVIAPNPWFNGCEMPDICPEEWLRISGRS